MISGRLLCFTLSTLLVSGVAHAQGLESDLEGDTQLARTYFDAGNTDYARGDYKRALAAFEEARRLRPFPELDYDIATCYEKLGNYRAAIVRFEQFLDESPDARNAGEIRDRIAALRSRLGDSRRWIVPGAVGGGALVLGIVGAALVGSVASPLHDLDKKWAAAPSVALQHQAWSLHDRAIAGDVILGVAGAAALVDIGLFVYAAKKSRR